MEIMLMESRETTDRSARRAGKAASAMARWFSREDDELARAIDIGRRHLAEHPGDTKTLGGIAELEEERRQLHAGWRNSSLRRAVAGDSDSDDAGREQRSVGLAPDHRATSTTSTTRTCHSISGYAALFDSPSPNWERFVERIRPGAFAKALEKSDTVCLFNHDGDHLLGRVSAATLELKEDSHGLHFRCYCLPFDPLSYRLGRLIERGDLCGASFSFTLGRDRWILARKPGDIDVRVIEEVETLWDVAVVTSPYYPRTTVAATFENLQRAAPARGIEADEPVDPSYRWEPSHGFPDRRRFATDKAFDDAHEQWEWREDDHRLELRDIESQIREGELRDIERRL
jgi:uncharacterized protein